MSPAVIEQLNNHDKEDLRAILRALEVPPNYRVSLDACPDTERLRLTVAKAKPLSFKFFGRQVVLSEGWDTQRRITGRSYKSILDQLAEQPEFLEFELVFGGKVA